MNLVIDLSKAGRLNTAKLVKRPVQVRGKDGKVYTRMQWVDPNKDLPKEERVAKPEEQSFKRVPKMESPYKKRIAQEEQYLNKIRSADTDIKQAVKAFVDKYKSNPDLLYKIMLKVNAIDKLQDPRTVGAWGKNGDGTAPIRHMKNMMALKKILEGNSKLIDEIENDPEYQIAGAPKATKSKNTSVAQKGGNDIKGILDNMSREEKYALMARLGITDRDPGLVPEWGKDGNNTAPIRHMKNMMALKKAVELDPSTLNVTDSGEPNETEKKRLKSRDKDEKLKDKVHEFIKEAGRDLVLEWAKDFEDNEHMKNRIKSTHEHIDRMHITSALKAILMDDPSLMEGDMGEELEKYKLKNLKITNKQMQKVLIHAVGLKGIGDVSIVEKGIEWSFGEGSFARIDEDEDGNPVLSIVDTGKDGEGWDEHVYPMKKVKEFLDGLSTEKVKPKEVPLHKQNPINIWKELNKNFGKYTDAVGEALKDDIGKAFIQNGRDPSIKDISGILNVTPETLGRVLDKMGVERSSQNQNRFDHKTDTWRKIAYSHLIEPTKTKNANEYVQRWNDKVFRTRERDTWVLHESAKLWTPQEREQARKEMISEAIVLKGMYKNEFPDYEDRLTKLNNHIHNSLSFIPFDLMTDVIAGGCKFHFDRVDSDNKPFVGNFYNPNNRGIWFDFSYFEDKNAMGSISPAFRPADRARPGGGMYRSHAFSDTTAHEFAHALDHFLTGYNGFIKWTNDKYVTGKDKSPVLTSYNKTVERSNPSKMLGAARNGNEPYFFHKDEWMSTYEGRIYNSDYYNKGKVFGVIKDTWDGRQDAGWKTHDDWRGLEHFSENTARYSNAFLMYREWKDESGDTGTGFHDWTEKMYNDFLNLGYGDDSNEGRHYRRHGAIKDTLKSYKANGSEGIKDNPREAYGYLVHRMRQSHPELYEAIDSLYGRSDFVDDKSVPSLKHQYESGEYYRKSETPELILYI